MIPNSPLAQFIRALPLFSLVDANQVHEVIRLLHPTVLRAGEILFREGEPGRSTWILTGGSEVSLSSRSPGRMPALSTLTAGALVGEMALVDDAVRSTTATVRHGGDAYLIHAREFQTLRAAFAPVAFQILRKLCVDLCLRLRQTNEKIAPSRPRAVNTPSLPSGRRPDISEVDRFPAFRSLPAVVKFALAQKLELISVSEVVPLFAEGDSPDGAWFVVSGEVSVGRNGRTLANLRSGSMFGVVACIDHGLRSASCVTAGAAELLRINQADFEFLFASGHRFAFQMVDLIARQLAQNLREANQMIDLKGQGAGMAGISVPVDRMLDAEPSVDDLYLLSDEIEIDDALPLETELDLAVIDAEHDPLG